MGKWNIEDLDKSKTEQSIINEQNRLNNCRKSLDKLKSEYEQKRYENMCKLANLEDKITTLEGSISGGEEFIRKCNEHLRNDF